MEQTHKPPELNVSWLFASNFTRYCINNINNTVHCEDYAIQSVCVLYILYRHSSHDVGQTKCNYYTVRETIECSFDTK